MASYKNQTKLEEELIERANKTAEDHAKRAGKQIIDQEIDENLSKFETDSAPHVQGIKEKLKFGISKYNLNLHSTVFFLLCCQLLVSFFLLLFLDIFTIILSLVFGLVLMFIGIIYCVSYCLIWKYPQRFKKSSSCFLMCLVLAICEGVVLCFVSLPISPSVFLIEVSMLIISLFVTCIVAKYKKENYSPKIGTFVTVLTTLALFIIFIASLSDDRLWLGVCTSLLCGYEWFLVYKVSSVINFIKNSSEEEVNDNFQNGLYASLLIFKSQTKI